MIAKIKVTKMIMADLKYEIEVESLFAVKQKKLAGFRIVAFDWDLSFWMR